jgi:CHAT domain-containing protein
MLPVVIFLSACNENKSAHPSSLNQNVPVHPVIQVANNTAAQFKGNNWHAWCATYSTFYDSLLNIESGSGLVLLKQPLLDSIIQYKQYYRDSTLALLRNACYNRAYDLDEDAQYYLAKEDFETVLRMGASIGFHNFQQEFVSLNRLANILNMQGDIRQSVLIRQRQIERSEKDGTHNQLATAYLNLAILYNDTGQPDTAVNILERALSLSDVSNWSRAKLYSTLASVQAPVNNEAATASSNKALSLLDQFTAEGDTLDFLAGTYETLAYIARENKDPGAEQFYKLAIQKKIEYEGTEKQREIGKAYLALAEFYRSTGNDWDEAPAIQKALYTVTNVDSNALASNPSKEQLYPENTIMEALDAKASWIIRHAVRDDSVSFLRHAITCLDLAFEVERKLMQHFSFADSKLLMLQESRKRSETAIECCYQLYQLTKEAQWINKAWQFAEKSKAIVLLHSIRENIAASSLRQDSEYVHAQQLESLLAITETSLYELTNKNNPDDSAQVPALVQKKENIEQQLLDARVRLRHDNNAYRYLLEKEDSLDLAPAGKKLLDHSTALIEYFAGDSAAYAFCLSSSQQPELIVLPKQTNQQTDAFLAYFHDSRAIINDPAGYEKAAFNLYQSLLLPLIKNKSLHSLIIIPDEKLSTLPFDALLTQSPTSSNLSTLPYLIHQYKISFGYSIVTLLNQSATTGNKNVAGFAPVSFADKPSLPYTADEMEALRKTFSNANIFLQQQASLHNFKMLAPNAATIHIASHASADSGGIKPFIEFADSTLYLDELYSLHFNANLVVLSTCESGAGKIEKGEGAMSLARGFYYAGARNIINSLWKVNDRSTAQLFNSFYKYAGGLSYAQALRSAKLSYLENNQSGAKSSPFYWAGFVIIGQSEATTEWKIYAIGIIAAILIVSALATAIKKKKQGPGTP